jgi:hypothetical protein
MSFAKQEDIMVAHKPIETLVTFSALKTLSDDVSELASRVFDGDDNIFRIRWKMVVSLVELGLKNITETEAGSILTEMRETAESNVRFMERHTGAEVTSEDRDAIVAKLKAIIDTITPQIEGREFPDLMDKAYR